MKRSITGGIFFLFMLAVSMPAQAQNPQFMSTLMISMNAPDIMGATYASYNGQLQ